MKQSRCPIRGLKPLDLVVLAGEAEHREPFLQEVADEGHAEQILGGPLVMRTSFGFLTHRWPITGRVIISPQPRQGDKIDLLVVGERINERREFLDDGVTFVLFKYRNVFIVGGI